MKIDNKLKRELCEFVKITTQSHIEKMRKHINSEVAKHELVYPHSIIKKDIQNVTKDFHLTYLTQTRKLGGIKVKSVGSFADTENYIYITINTCDNDIQLNTIKIHAPTPNSDYTLNSFAIKRYTDQIIQQFINDIDQL